MSPGRRELLLGLVAGIVTPTATIDAIAVAFDAALAEPQVTVDHWLAKLDRYGVDYMSVGAGTCRLASPATWSGSAPASMTPACARWPPGC
jgi:hypothetical protein